MEILHFKSQNMAKRLVFKLPKHIGYNKKISCHICV